MARIPGRCRFHRCYELTAEGRDALGGCARQLAELDVLERLDTRAC